MKLFCADCGCYFDKHDKIYKEEIKDINIPYRFYHKRCLPFGAKIIDVGNLKHFTDKLDGKYRAEPVMPLCECCHKPLVQRSNRQKYCEECMPEVKRKYDRKYKQLKRQLLLPI